MFENCLRVSVPQRLKQNQPNAQWWPSGRSGSAQLETHHWCMGRKGECSKDDVQCRSVVVARYQGTEISVGRGVEFRDYFLGKLEICKLIFQRYSQGHSLCACVSRDERACFYVTMRPRDIPYFQPQTLIVFVGLNLTVCL